VGGRGYIQGAEEYGEKNRQPKASRKTGATRATSHQEREKPGGTAPGTVVISTGPTCSSSGLTPKGTRRGNTPKEPNSLRGGLAIPCNIRGERGLMKRTYKNIQELIIRERVLKLTKVRPKEQQNYQKRAALASSSEGNGMGPIFWKNVGKPKRTLKQKNSTEVSKESRGNTHGQGKVYCIPRNRGRRGKKSQRRGSKNGRWRRI